MKKIKDLKSGEEYYFDENTNKVYALLKCYHQDGTYTEEYFEYYYSEKNYSKPY